MSLPRLTACAPDPPKTSSISCLPLGRVWPKAEADVHKRCRICSYMKLLTKGALGRRRQTDFPRGKSPYRLTRLAIRPYAQTCIIGLINFHRSTTKAESSIFWHESPSWFSRYPTKRSSKMHLPGGSTSPASGAAVASGNSASMSTH